VSILAIGLSGLQQEGAAFWVTPLFNGLTLLAAVGMAGFAARRRQRAGTAVGARSRPGSPPTDSTPDGDPSGDPPGAVAVAAEPIAPVPH